MGVMRAPVIRFQSIVAAILCISAAAGGPARAEADAPPPPPAPPASLHAAPAGSDPARPARAPSAPDPSSAAPSAPPPLAVADPSAAPDLDTLFAELAQPDGPRWQAAQADIQRLWSQSGSASADLLRQRGEAALDRGDSAAAIGHLTALTDHAPDFAEGWALRAAAFAQAGQTGPALADLAQVLRLEPRHWPALTLLGTLAEEMGQDDRAARAWRASLALNPHQPEAADGLARIDSHRHGIDL